MLNLEEEYRKRFNKEELPEGDFDSAGLWDAIDKKLDDPTTPTKRAPHSLWLLLIGLSMGLFGLYFFNTTSTSTTTEQKETIIDVKKESMIAGEDVKLSPVQSSTIAGNEQRATQQTITKTLDPFEKKVSPNFETDQLQPKNNTANRRSNNKS